MPQPRDVRRFQRGDRLAIEHDLAGRACHRPMMVRSVVVLPAPFRPSSVVTRPRAHGEIDAVQDAIAADIGVDAFEPQQRCRRSRHCSGPRRDSRPCDAEIGLLHLRQRHHLGRRAVGDQRAVLQHDDAVGEPRDHVHAVLDQEHGLVRLRFNLLDQIEDGRDFVEAHAGSRLVEHQHPRLERQQDRDFELALVAMRQRRRPEARRAAASLTRSSQWRASSRTAVLRAAMLRTIEADLRDRLHREPHILEHREARIEIDQLERAAEPEPGAVRRAEPGDVLAEQAHAAGGRRATVPRSD